jgi:hypothetical protein
MLICIGTLAHLLRPVSYGVDVGPLWVYDDGCVCYDKEGELELVYYWAAHDYA